MGFGFGRFFVFDAWAGGFAFRAGGVGIGFRFCSSISKEACDDSR